VGHAAAFPVKAALEAGRWQHGAFSLHSPLTPSTRLDRPQVLVCRSLVWRDQTFEPTNFSGTRSIHFGHLAAFVTNEIRVHQTLKITSVLQSFCTTCIIFLSNKFLAHKDGTWLLIKMLKQQKISTTHNFS